MFRKLLSFFRGKKRNKENLSLEEIQKRAEKRKKKEQINKLLRRRLDLYVLLRTFENRIKKEGIKHGKEIIEIERIKKDIEKVEKELRKLGVNFK